MNNIDLGLLENCEQLIRVGRMQEAAKIIDTINTAQVPRELRRQLANICRRVGRVKTGLQILAPIVHPGRRTESPTNEEKAEYAVLLQRSGVIHEALKILDEIPPERLPQSLLYKAFCQFSTWDYELSIPILRSYIQHIDNDYAKLVGQVNLASAMVIAGNTEEAQASLDETILLCDQHQAHRLKANSLELRAQLHLNRHAWAAAEVDLNNALQILDSQGTHDQLFIRQWQAILESRRTGESFWIREFKKEALGRKQWESAREADLHTLLVSFDQGLFNHLYFGTPWEGYRRYMTRLLPEARPADTYIRGPRSVDILDLVKGQYAGRNILHGDMTHRLLKFLNQDFYRPKSVNSIFNEVFPNEHFDVITSPQKVHQAIRRARVWLKEQSIPASIKESQQTYSFSIDGACAVEFSQSTAQGIHRNTVAWERLSPFMRSAPTMTNKEISEILNLGKTRVTEFMKWATDQGLVKRLGQGRSVKYMAA